MQYFRWKWFVRNVVNNFIERELPKHVRKAKSSKVGAFLAERITERLITKGMNGMSIFKLVLILTGFIVLSLNEVAAQKQDDVMMGIIEEGDTIIHKNLIEITVLPEREFRNARQARRYGRLVDKVKKVYPYARLASEMLDEYEPKYLALESDKEKRQMMKELEQKLLDEYKDDLKRMTLSEGRILLKLIDRETTRTSYTLIKEFRGGVSATFWQGIARLFGSNLKSGYEPDGEDQMVEEIVRLIEVGYI